MAKEINMNQDAANDEEMTVTLTLDDGTDLECVVLTIFEAADKEYIALLPLDGNEAEDGEVYLYRYSEDAEGNPDIQNIESDEEYEIVADAFDEFLDTAEYDEIVSEDDLDDYTGRKIVFSDRVCQQSSGKWRYVSDRKLVRRQR